MKPLFFTLFFLLSISQPIFADDIAKNDDSDSFTLSPIDVLGESHSSDLLEAIPTVSKLQSKELLKKNRNSLGETLKNEVGVNSTQFGPAASRPVIRGLGGERIKILQNGIGSLDASGTSQDHAVPINPLSADSIEIVRGPITLLYGSSAIGGVVNIVNSKIQRQYTPGFLGNFDLKRESVNQANNIAANLNYGINNFAFHLDGNYVHAENTETPVGEILNSEMEQSSLSFGTTYFLSHRNYFGLSYSHFQNTYGVVAEPDVDINLKQQRVDLLAHFHIPGFFKAVQIKSAQTFYKHTEMEDGQTGTIFENSGNETRIELIQKNKGILSGTLGVQTQKINLSALGDEAFLPTTDQVSAALFAFEEIKLNHWKLNAGLRGELTDLSSDDMNFFSQSQENNFSTLSAAFGSLFSISNTLSTSLNVSLNERAPTYQELYAQGAHLAVGIYEQGDINLNKENSQSIEWSLRYKNKENSARLNVFNQDFQNYIGLNPTGTFDDTDESSIAGDSPEDFEIFNYVSQKARIQGVELEFTHKLSSNLNTRFTFDYLHGKNRETNDPLPRISPLRIGTSFEYEKNSFLTSLEWQNVFRQTHTASNETNTPSYNLINGSVNYNILLKSKNLLKLYWQVNNIGDVKAFNHVSVIKRKSPLPGRNLIFGARLIF